MAPDCLVTAFLGSVSAQLRGIARSSRVWPGRNITIYYECYRIIEATLHVAIRVEWSEELLQSWFEGDNTVIERLEDCKNRFAERQTQEEWLEIVRERKQSKMGPREEAGDRPISSLSSSSSCSSRASSVKSEPGPGPGGKKRNHSDMEMECTGDFKSTRPLKEIFLKNIIFFRFLWLWRVWPATSQEDKQNEHWTPSQWSDESSRTDTNFIRNSSDFWFRDGSFCSEISFSPGLSLLQ